jgi:hypothetical protein
MSSNFDVFPDLSLKLRTRRFIGVTQWQADTWQYKNSKLPSGRREKIHVAVVAFARYKFIDILPKGRVCFVGL